MRMRRGMSIRAKVALLSVVLLATPYVGYRYLQEVETLLRQRLEDQVLESARAMAGALHDRPDLLAPDPATRSGAGDVYVHALRHAPEVDGYVSDDWEDYLPHRVALQPLAGAARPATLSATLLAGKHGSYLYLLVRVEDDRIVYGGSTPGSEAEADHVEVVTVTPPGAARRYVLASVSPGWIPAYEVTRGAAGWRRPLAVRVESRIRAQWQERPGGYDLEMRIPVSLLGTHVGVTVGDVDSLGGAARAPQRVSTSADGRPGVLLLPSAPIEALIRSLGRTHGRRVFVVDGARRVVARGGSLERPAAAAPRNPLVALLLRPPAADAFREEPTSPRLDGPEVTAALSGTGASRWRSLPGSDAFVVSGSHPVWSDNAVIGAVVVEETSLGIQTLRYQALADLFDKTLLVTIAGGLVLLLLATRISVRISRLRDAAENAIDDHGRVVGRIEPSGASDEIGDLTRSVAAMVDRLRQYNHYLEMLSRRLSHELRTPIAVVRSSLEALSLSAGDRSAEVYVGRARDGVERLDTILTRMSEAARLEQTLEGADRERFDIARVVRMATDAYRATWPAREFRVTLPGGACEIDGNPELVVQLLDKLVANALEFGDPAHPVEVAVAVAGDMVRLTVANRGTPLPAQMQAGLFDSMVSIRAGGGDTPHLGLGLYIVRLIAEFHGGSARAENLAGDSGVKITVDLPLK